MNIVGITGQAGTGKDEIAKRLVTCHDFKQLALADPIKRFGMYVFGFDALQLWGPSSARNTFDPRYNQCDIRSKGVNFVPGCSLSSVTRACDPGWGDAAVNLTQFAPGWVGELVKGKKERKKALEDLYFWFGSLGHHYAELSPRIMLQHLGTEWGRECVDPDIWINSLISTTDQILKGYKYDRETGFSGERVPPPRGVVVSDVRFANELKCIKKADGRIVKVTRKAAAQKAKKLGISNHASETEQEGFKDDQFDAVLANEGSIKELHAAVDIVAAAHFGERDVD